MDHRTIVSFFTCQLVWVNRYHQGCVQDELWMSLPLEVPRKTLEEIPSRKRASYKARYQLLDQLGSELQANLLRS